MQQELVVQNETLKVVELGRVDDDAGLVRWWGCECEAAIGWIL